MDDFSGLGDAGTASLRAVAPGIAEALITTAAGLAAAIPALIAYNHFLQGIRTLASRMENFASEFVSKIETMYS
jgi:biopolymer transport protein TolQ